MKKFFIGLTLLILLIVGSVFGILFTKAGNNFIASYIENKVNSGQQDVQLKVNDFVLTFNTINFDATINDNSNINLSGDLEIFKKKVDLKYDIKINELSNLQNLTKQKLNGPFSTSGTFKGNESLAVINGISNVASSDTNYNLQLVDFKPSNISFSVKSAKIDELLNLVNQPKVAKGILNINGNVKDANLASLDGKITANISKGKLLNKTFNKAYNQKLQIPVSFNSDILATLSPNLATIKSDSITSLAEIFTNKTLIDLKSGKITSDYKLAVKNLSKLEGLIGQKLNGSFNTSGDLIVNNGIIKVDGKTNIFESLTKYNVKITNAKPEYIKFSIIEAKIEKLLHFINEPVYATGILDIEGDIKNANVPSLDGVITTKILNGKLVNKVVNTVFKQNLKKKVTFNGDVNTKLVPNQAITKAAITSSLANLNVKKAVFDLKEASLNSDYLLKIPSLSKLYDVTSTKMRGKLDITGNIKNKAKSLLLTGNSKLLGGALDFTLKNNDFIADIKGVEVKQLTHMMYYPEVFDSKSALNIKYNLLSKKGKLTGNLLKGHFLKNNFSGLINQFARFDLTREIYDTVSINSDINNLVLKSVIAMKSRNTQIDVTRSVLNLEKSLVDADVKAKIRKLNLDFGVKGNTKRPKIKLNTKNVLKDKIEEKINKKLDKVLKDKLGDEGTKEIIKNFKSLF